MISQVSSAWNSKDNYTHIFRVEPIMILGLEGNSASKVFVLHGLKTEINNSHGSGHYSPGAHRTEKRPLGRLHGVIKNAATAASNELFTDNGATLHALVLMWRTA